jgi:predicted MPP superfamily phosphohydrolase
MPAAFSTAMRQRWQRAVSLVVAVPLFLACWAFWFEPRRLVVHRFELDLPNWPREEAGLTIALLSDLHVGSRYWGIDRLHELVERTNAERPDLVLLAGDYMINGTPFELGKGKPVEPSQAEMGSPSTGWVAPEPIADGLSDLRAPLGVIAVLGNHDWWNDGERMRRALEERHIVVLENQVRALEFRGARFFVAGLADTLTRPVHLDETLDAVPENEPLLLLVHEPDVFPEVGARPSLTLAGHTHGGQVVLPLFGRRVVPSRFGQRYAAGHIVENGRHLVVTTGVGTSIYPVRFGVPPEIALITLR